MGGDLFDARRWPWPLFLKNVYLYYLWHYRQIAQLLGRRKKEKGTGTRVCVCRLLLLLEIIFT